MERSDDHQGDRIDVDAAGRERDQRGIQNEKSVSAKSEDVANPPRTMNASFNLPAKVGIATMADVSEIAM